jgi:serine/threonine-protein phosphatase 4 catalytic subunit/serine/threonine-protein phosphatase PP1-1
MENTVCEKMSKLLKREPNVVNLEGKVVFVGDTHGDSDASKRVFVEYQNYAKVFTGDYVDRGDDSMGNIDFLLKQKLKSPNKVHLLVGNHEGKPISPCYPCDFWESLDRAEYERYEAILPNLPLVAYGNGVLAVHGVPPDVQSLEEIKQIKPGDEKWKLSIWGDFNEETGDYLGKSSGGRPQFGRDYFLRVMKNLKAKTLIRSHQPDVPLKMFNGECYTIFTSNAYLDRRQSRTVIVADLSKKEFEVKEI